MTNYKKLQTKEDLEIYIHESKLIAQNLSMDFINEYNDGAFEDFSESIIDLAGDVFHLISIVCMDIDTENPFDLALQIFQTAGVNAIQKTLFEKSQKDDLITALRSLLHFFVSALTANGESRYGIEWPREGYFITSFYVMDRTSDNMVEFSDILENISREKLIEPTAARIGLLIHSDIIEIIEDRY